MLTILLLLGRMNDVPEYKRERLTEHLAITSNVSAGDSNRVDIALSIGISKLVLDLVEDLHDKVLFMNCHIFLWYSKSWKLFAVKTDPLGTINTQRSRVSK